MLSLDFDPRHLLSNRSLPLEGGIDNSGLDGIFIPTRNRAGYLRELLFELQILKVPIFIMPSVAVDHQGIPEESSTYCHILHLDNAGFTNIINQLRTFSHERMLLSIPGWDLPAKRNYALWYARSHGMRKILFLDDDIRGLTPEMIDAGAHALSTYRIAGFFVDDFPDHSTVSHIRKQKGHYVPTFLTGSCLFVDLKGFYSFFPYIYNEDWLFMLPYLLSGLVCSLGTLRQVSYDPIENPIIATYQEFGEVISIGLFAIAIARIFDQRYRPEIWDNILKHRQDQLGALLQGIGLPCQSNAIDLALRQCKGISVADCLSFLHDFEEDTRTWNRAIIAQSQGEHSAI